MCCQLSCRPMLNRKPFNTVKFKNLCDHKHRSKSIRLPYPLEWIALYRSRGRVPAEPSLQLGTLSTRIANLLCIIHSALSRLSCPCVSTAAVLRTGGRAHTRAWRPSAARGQTDARQTRLTNQPTGQQPFCQYPAVSCEIPL